MIFRYNPARKAVMAKGKLIMFPSPRGDGATRTTGVPTIPGITIDFVSWPELSLGSFMRLQRTLGALRGINLSNEVAATYERTVHRYTDRELAGFVNDADSMKIAARPIFYSAVMRETKKRMDDKKT